MSAIKVTESSGSSGAIQLADGSGDFTNISTFTFDTTNKRLGVGTASPTHKVHIIGDVSISGSLFARDYHSEIVSSSIIFKSGSTKFGDSTDDLHQFTGSVMINDGPLPGSNVSFFVSGAQTATTTPSTAGVAVFGGDVVISGTVFGGSPLKIAEDIEFIASSGATTSLKNPSGSVKVFAAEEVKIGSDDGLVRFIDLGGSTAGKIFLTGSNTTADRRFKFLTKGQLHFHGKAPNAVSPGGDVWFYVSGAIADQSPIPRGAALFGGDVVSSGTLKVVKGISGSLTRLSDGNSYLVAGSNVTIVTSSAGQVRISATGESGSEIGSAEDSDYTDGLFSDFTSSTAIGTAIDRFNEVLKALAPDPASGLDDINSTVTGVTASLSFGASNNQSSGSPAYITVAAGAGIGTAVDVNTSYTVTTSSNDLRLGVFTGNTHVSGILNADVAYNSQGNSVQNYPAYSFGDADTGVLRLDVNGSTIKEIDLSTSLYGSGTSGIGSGSYLDAVGSGFNLFSLASSGTLSNGNSFGSFKHRTGQFVVASGSQRRGWNYARVLHVKTGSTKTTNYIEWVNDDNSDALAGTGESMTFEGSGSIHLSGIQYYQSGSARYKVRVANAYKYVYDTGDIIFTPTNTAAASSSVSFSISSQTKPSINTGGGETHTKFLHLTGTGNITADYFLSGAVSSAVNVTHPLKSDLTNAGSAEVNGILMYNLSNSSTALVESFRRENYRIISGAYSTQASLTDASNTWDSTKHITASNGGHSNGLQFYNQRLYSPTKTLLSGDFRDNGEGGTLSNSPPKNPNYSGESGQKTFYRWFKNETGSTKYDLTVAINGSGTIVTAATALNSSRIRVFVKFPSDGTRETAWLDLATEFALDSYSDNDGAHTANGSLSFDSSLNATNYVTLGTVGIGNNEYIGLRIEADAAWSGYISQVTVSFGAGTGTITAIPDLDDIDCNDDGTDSNLSFGSSKAVTGYTSVGTTAGFSAVDVNGLYQTAASSNNLRRSVFALSTIIEGDLNEDVSSNSNDSHVNHTANAFSDANSGSLKLEVNGAVVHTVEITGSYNLVGSGVPGSGGGTALNGNGSGFFSLSTWEAAEYNNGVPDYTEIYRTGKWRVVTADQRNGWNYARVIHTVGGSDRETNYVEWVNDNNSNALTSASFAIQAFQDDNLFHLSGVKYFTSPSGTIESKISNLYKNVYSDSNSAISFTSLTNATAAKIVQSGSGLSSTKSTSSSTDSLQTLNTTTDSQAADLHATGTISFSRSKSLMGTWTTAYNCGGAMVFVHPLKSNLTTATASKTTLHVYSASDNSNANTNEYFNGEQFRVQSGSYTTQASVTAVSNKWSSTGSMNDNGSYPGYYTGLMIYDSYLISPFKGGNSGDFRSHGGGGVLEGPSGNVNYSSLGVATREYYRGFLNNTTDDRPSVTITLYGDATIVGRTGANSGSLGTNKNVYVDVRIPGKTAFLDLGRPSAGSGNISTGDGCLSGDLDATIDGGGAENVCTFNGQTVDGTTSGAQYFILRLSADKNWAGYVNQITVAWSA